MFVAPYLEYRFSLGGGIRGFADADNLGDLFDRFAVVVDEVDHLAVLRRQFCQRLAQEFAATLLLQGGLGVASFRRRTRGGGRIRATAPSTTPPGHWPTARNR